MQTLKIGNLSLQLILSPGWDENYLSGRYAGFLATSPPGFVLEIKGETGFRDGAYSEDELGVQKVRFTRNRVFLSGRDVGGEFDLIARRGTVRLDYNMHTLDSVVCDLLMVLLPLRGGLLLHAAAMGQNGAGWLACGPSGSGKSSLARAVRRGVVLNDERACLVREGKSFCITGTPFWGELPPDPINAPMRLPLSKLWLLGAPASGPLKAVQALPLLLENVIYPDGGDSGQCAAIMELAWETVNACPCTGMAADWYLA